MLLHSAIPYSLFKVQADANPAGSCVQGNFDQGEMYKAQHLKQSESTDDFSWETVT